MNDYLARLTAAFGPIDMHAELDTTLGRLTVSFANDIGRLPRLMCEEAGVVVGRRHGIEVVSARMFGHGLVGLWGQGVVKGGRAYYVLPTHDEIIARGPRFKARDVVGWVEGLREAQVDGTAFLATVFRGCAVCRLRCKTGGHDPSIGWCSTHAPDAPNEKLGKSTRPSKPRGKGRQHYDRPLI